MIKIFKTIVISTVLSVTMSSCLNKDGNEAKLYVELYSVVKSSNGVTCFSSDDGIDLYPSGGFQSRWGNVGDRVLVGFYYNPYTVSESATRMDITVEILYSIQTHSAALPSTVDTVGNGAFPYENSGEQAIAAWIAQNYLTILFSIRYSDATKHTFGFIEEPEPCRNDTLFLSLWHTTKEDGKNRTAKSYIALNLSDYVSYLSARDSTVVAIKYRAENTNTSDINSRTYHAIYRRTNNTTN